MAKTYLNYNGYDLTEYIDVYLYNNPLLPERENISIDISSMNGLMYQCFKYKSRPIELGFDVKAKDDIQLKERLDIIAKAFDVDEPAKLYVENADKYFWAIPKNSIDKNKLCKGYTEIEIDLICYDPHMYSDEIKLFEGDSNNLITIENNGSAETYPSINVAFQNDAHFLQVTNAEGKVILLGDRVDADSESFDPNPLVLDDWCEETTNWLNAGNVVDANMQVDGSVTISDDGNYICPSNFGTAVEGISWHGPAVRRNIGQNLTDFEVVARLKHISNGANSNNGSSNTTNGNYKTTSKSALNIRSGRGTGYKVIGSIPKSTTVNITDISKGWGKVTYKGKTGYVSMSYLTKVTSKSTSKATTREVKNENKMGRLELYLFDSNGQKLAKFVLRDSEYYFEYTTPEVWIGSNKVLSDGKKTPTPKTTTKKENDKTVTQKVVSGSYGDWNDYFGEFKIRRETKNGKQYWYCEITKIVNGKVVKTIKTSSTLNSSSYPKGNLNHVVLFMGQHKDIAVVDEIGLTDLKVRKLNQTDNITVDYINFRAGDEVEIDCGSGDVLLNGFDCIDKVDIGSQFFSSPSGTSQFVVNSDDEEIYTSAIIQERWRNS